MLCNPPEETLRRSAKDKEKIAAWNGYFCYFGTYTVDEQEQTVTHHVAGSLFPNYVGTEQIRRCSIRGNRLSLTAEAPWGHVELVWEKRP
ncbi:MAG: lipocalin-like domain-containing protein [Candidatus Eremiobacteraeota bacterium]|nr:lipocalin-like domain-containing protein [Candidatus Eremiobacteraeota bacterium]